MRAFEETGLTFYTVEDGPGPPWLGALGRHEANGEHRSSYGGLAHGRHGGDAEVLVLTGTPGALDASSALALVVGRRSFDADRREPPSARSHVDGVGTVLRGTTGAAGTAVGAALPDGHELWVASRGRDLEGAVLTRVTDLRPAGRPAPRSWSGCATALRRGRTERERPLMTRDPGLTGPTQERPRQPTPQTPQIRREPT